jgi:putative flippase GtrA
VRQTLKIGRMPLPTTARARLQALWIRYGTKVFRYATGSVIAAICSETVFVIMYGALDTSTTWATIVGWIAGALPNYWLNRSWTWNVRGRPHVVRELLPYILIIVTTLVTAIVTTDLVDSWLNGRGLSHGVETVLVAATFLGVYGVMFLLRFFLLDRLFARLGLPPVDLVEEPTPVKS